jgi:hypothetical protein
VAALLEIKGEGDEPEFTTLIESVTPIEPVERPTAKTADIPPQYNSTEWHDYVMSQFTTDELTDDYPNIFGLRRVGEALLGDIVQSGPITLFPPAASDEGPGRSSCIYTIVFNWFNGGREVEFRAAAGSSPNNTNKDFAIYPECIAETRAEARALRKALKLRCVSSEELPQTNINRDIPTSSTGEWNPNDKISTTQQIFLTQRLKESKIDLTKFINHNGYKYASLDEVTKQTAKEMIELVNSYQTTGKGSKTIPEDILISH